MMTQQLENGYGSAIPLTMVNTGEYVHGKDDTRRFLETLGFTENAEVVVVAELGGNMIINVKGTRVAVSKAMAARIMTGC